MHWIQPCGGAQTKVKQYFQPLKQILEGCLLTYSPLSLLLFFSSPRHHIIIVIPSFMSSTSSQLPAPLIHLLNISSPFLPPPPLPSPPFCSWRSSWRGGGGSTVLFLRTVLLVQNTDGYYGAAHKLIMLEINCCCQRQPPTCPTVSLCPLMHRIQLMDQMFAQCAAPFKVSTKVVWGALWSSSRCICSLCPLASWYCWNLIGVHYFISPFNI